MVIRIENYWVLLTVNIIVFSGFRSGIYTKFVMSTRQLLKIFAETMLYLKFTELSRVSLRSFTAL